MSIGTKLKKLRTENMLTQSELADRCDLTKGYISQLERDLTSPSIVTLEYILEALGVTLNEFFSEEEEEQVVFSDEDIFEKHDEELKHEVKWLIPKAQKNMMEPIMLTIEPGGRYLEEEAHEGEEFGYVLQGSIAVHLDKKVYKAKKGEWFYFKSKVKHYISNRGKGAATIIWVSTPPSF